MTRRAPTWPWNKKVRSPLERVGPPDDFTTPRWSNKHGAYIVECPNGEVIEFSAREPAWSAYRKLKEGI